MLKDTKNALLVKDDVGRSKPVTRDLPPEGFAFGKADAKDAEGVAEGNLQPTFLVTRSWQFHDHSSDIVPEKNFKKLNAMCVKKKALNPKVYDNIK